MLDISNQYNLQFVIQFAILACTVYMVHPLHPWCSQNLVLSCAENPK